MKEDGLSEILFDCPQCSKHLAVDGAAKGRIVKCVDCGQPVQVPWTVAAFECPSCAWVMSAPLGLAGESFSCPNCGEAVRIPALKQNFPSRSQAAPTCPSCGTRLQELVVGTLRCFACNTNFRASPTGAISPVALRRETEATKVDAGGGSAEPETCEARRKRQPGERFRFEAVSRNGREMQGMVEADSQSEAIQKIKDKGLFPTSVLQVDGRDGGLQLKATMPKPEGRRCPACRKPVASDDVLCVGCGTDLRTGKPARSEPAPGERTDANPALVKCRDCGADISPTADKCPKCGASTLTPGYYAAGCITLIVGSMILAAVFKYGCSVDESTSSLERQSVSREDSEAKSMSYETGKTCARMIKDRYVGVPDYDQSLQIARRMALNYPDIDMAEFERGFRDGW